ncbi:hypothetical protein KVT40_006307 [Elsinoe batatas]|uniref:Uncharacterized protein n=1 Tax=Elsinoe batatas TaxID=2601811 RepID=A0A8K0PDN5_9PEZI|nr:hypothetical protein KVT40_006307 [Elsinoe batatas]
MRSFIILATCAAAVSAVSDAYFDKLLKRQAPGTPQYDCHAACGGVITASRTEGFCDTDAFKTNFDSCMDCALVYNIWQYYGSSVGRAATTCGLEANPTPATAATTSSESSSSSAAAQTTSEAASSTTSASSTGEAATTASTSTTSSASSASVSSSAVVSSTTGSTSIAANATTPTTSSPPVASFNGAADMTRTKEGAVAVGLGIAAYILL